MREIRILDKHVANLIAAGEVVERPSSVAKELIENAIDSGATRITVEISRGGLEFIRVTDNGCGIPSEQLTTAFLRHATSKLRTEEQLTAIGTLGFRGEALAAISAVSRIEITSRTEGETFGAHLTLEGGTVTAQHEMGAPLGTTIIVRDLFFNTPARLKFLKNPKTEGATLYLVVQQLALSHPERSFQFIREQKQELVTSQNGTLASVLPEILGKSISEGMISTEFDNDNWSVRGFISTPTACRGSRNYQHFFVNGRYIKSPLLASAVETAYQNQKMVGKFPAVVLHITARADEVDINVHPAKITVKFTNEKDLFAFVMSGVTRTLSKDDRIQSVIKDEKIQFVEGRQLFHSPISSSPNHSLNSYSKPQKGDSGLWLSSEDQKPITAEKIEPSSIYEEEKNSFPSDKVRFEVTKPVEMDQVPVEKDVKPSYKQSYPPIHEETPLPLVEEEVPLLAEEIPPWRLIGECFATYILVEQGERILMIDKHAVHERINFDRLRDQTEGPMAQSLMIPISFAPSPPEREVLVDNLVLLEEFGYELEEISNGTILVRQIPCDIDHEKAEEALLDLADRFLQEHTVDPIELRDHVLHSISCQAAIKAGYKTGKEELEKLVLEVLTNRVRFCPHGRPVVIELSRLDLEKKFKRS
ncbi:MAG: DNA mismatch repair endonuclease MutL [Eubacteriales bacterium]